jgi:dTDP-4-amino-4,6-dideoxygalactose transaminase
LDLAPGDEVIVPAFTFVSTANAFALRGAVPVFADIRADTLNIDEARIEPIITKRTRAIAVVHYGGVGCDMAAIGRVAQRYGLALVEDNAHGLFGRYEGKPLGSFGEMATQSFHETKNFTCGEGGALVLNDEALLERAEILREKGTNRNQFFRGQVDKYTWVDTGSSYVPSDLLAAFLLAQLEGRNSIQERRAKVWWRYHDALRLWSKEHRVSQPTVPSACDQAYHLYYLLMPDLSSRTKLIRHLRERGILAVFHYQPLNCSPMGMRLGGRPGGCPVSEDIADRLVRLPFFNDLTEDEQTLVIDAVTSFDPSAES